MEIKDHKLIDPKVSFIETKNVSGKFKSGLPDTVIIHYTAGSSLESSVRTLCSAAAKASAHLVIGRDGKIVQLAPFNVVTWHAGKSVWKDRIGLNNYSIGIELDNAGPMTKTDTGYISWFNKPYPESEIIKAKHRNENTERYWHLFTEEQILVCKEVCSLLIDKYHIRMILGHEEISPGRKTDPGPAFPLDKLRNDLLINPRSDDRAPDEVEKYKVTTDKLNIRTGAGTEFPAAAPPLPRNTVVKLVERKGKWMKVSTVVEGWIHSDYIDPA